MNKEDQYKLACTLNDQVSAMVDGLPSFAICQALTTVLACIICEESEQHVEMIARLEAVTQMLREQCETDFPKIRKMIAEGAPSPHILPQTRM